MSDRFIQDRGTVSGDSEAWARLVVEVSRLTRMKHQVSGVWPPLLLDFLRAGGAAAEAAPTRAVSDAKGPSGAFGRVGESTKEAAMRMRCSEQHVRALVRAGRLPAQRIGRTWVIEPGATDRRRPRSGS
ncbi:helix-turn-helix domain-containing protein [Amnibacterium kyonggiense]|uniref:helix-turn-helix domain-containing protein n=1 Tax=Amnibacterium kyonggiense TaxID=595671 RepID=UPI00105DC16F|nr:helix-turn-helix domain-containing protein [Amnibacterium kyonggiense]